MYCNRVTANGICKQLYIIASLLWLISALKIFSMTTFKILNSQLLVRFANPRNLWDQFSLGHIMTSLFLKRFKRWPWFCGFTVLVQVSYSVRPKTMSDGRLQNCESPAPDHLWFSNAVINACDNDSGSIRPFCRFQLENDVIFGSFLCLHWENKLILTNHIQ